MLGRTTVSIVITRVYSCFAKYKQFHLKQFGFCNYRSAANPLISLTETIENCLDNAFFAFFFFLMLIYQKDLIVLTTKFF